MKLRSIGVLIGTSGSLKSTGFIIKSPSLGFLYANVVTMEGEYGHAGSNIAIPIDEWVYLALTWSENAGIRVFLNGCSVYHANHHDRSKNYAPGNVQKLVMTYPR